MTALTAYNAAFFEPRGLRLVSYMTLARFGRAFLAVRAKQDNELSLWYRTSSVAARWKRDSDLCLGRAC